MSLAAAVGLLPVAGSGKDDAPAGRVLFHLTDQRIGESSGIAIATREPGVWFTHNDSGDSARFFALGPAGQTLATYDVDNARNIDWEDMAAAPSLTGVPTLWFADTGDNQPHRSTVDVYAVPEPRVSPGLRGAAVHVSSVRYRFRYPDGAHDAESLMVDPRTSRVYIGTKSYDGTTEVYAAPAKLSAKGVNQMTLVTILQWAPHPVLSLADVPVELATTGGAFSPDGHTVALRTYTDVYLFRVAGSGPAALKAALSAAPQRLMLPKQPQGEGICFRRDGNALVLSSERIGSAVEEVVLPRVVDTPQIQPAPTAVATTSPVAPRSSRSPAPTTSASAVAAPVRARHRSAVPVVAGALALVLLLGSAFGVLRQRRGGPAR
jgi:hypothetical protein